MPTTSSSHNPRGAFDHVDMTVGQRIERAGIKRDADHGLLSIAGPGRPEPAQCTPSFFCRLEEEVVYWNVRRLSG